MAKHIDEIPDTNILKTKNQFTIRGHARGINGGFCLAVCRHKDQDRYRTRYFYLVLR